LLNKGAEDDMKKADRLDQEVKNCSEGLEEVLEQKETYEFLHKRTQDENQLKQE